MSTTVQWDSLDEFFGRTTPDDEESYYRRCHTAEVDAAIAAEDCPRLCRLAQEDRIHAYSILDQIDRVMAFATVHDFDALLRLFSAISLDAEEHIGTHCLYPPWHISPGIDGLRIHGTLPALAVAMDRADLLEQLLQQGYPAEPPSPEPPRSLSPFEALLDRFSNLHIRGEVPPDSDSLSALALAVLLGRCDCAEVLLRHGAKLESHIRFGHAMYLNCRDEDEAYRRARELVLAHGDRAAQKPNLSDLRRCSLRQLREVLQRYCYTAEEWRSGRDLLNLMYADWKDCLQRLAEIRKVYPAALSDPSLTGAVFDHIGCSDFDPAPLLPLAEGCTLDLTAVLWIEIPVPLMRELLKQLSARCTLTADRMQFFHTVSSERLRLLLKYVHFYASERTAPISDLSSSLLIFGSTPLIRHALETGVINESTKDLVTFLSGSFVPERARAAVLTVKRDPALLLPDFEGE